MNTVHYLWDCGSEAAMTGENHPVASNELVTSHSLTQYKREATSAKRYPTCGNPERLVH